MSPEQCRGTAEIDGKSDVYSLGIIFFQLLVGHPPFMANSPGEFLSMHLRDRPPSLRKHPKAIPAPLADLVASMLDKEPQDRPAMLEVAQQLEALGAHRASQPPPSGETRISETVLAVASTPDVGGLPVPPLARRTPHPERGKHRIALALGLGLLLL